MFQLQKRQVEETVQSAGCRALGESLSGRLKIFRVTRGKKYLGKNQKTLGLMCGYSIMNWSCLGVLFQDSISAPTQI